MLNRSDVSLALCIAFVLSLMLGSLGSIAHAADHVVIILDDSGSMNEAMAGNIRKMDAAKRALAKVVEQIPDTTNVGILLLNGARANNHWLVPLGALDKKNATIKVNSIGANGGTPLGEAMRIASDQLLQARNKSVYGTYRLIVVTDGEATDKVLLDQYLPDILSRGLIVDAIGVNMAGNHSLATQVHSYRRADDEAALSNAIVEILAESSGDNSGSSDSDFELLNALNDVDAGEILKALAKPNNDPVTGYSARTSAVAPPEPTWVPPPPAVIPTAAQAPEKTGFFEMLFGTFCTCMLPILVAVMIFITVAASGNRKRNR
ncbi:MAG: VWA domain-containing protein [Planctomycetes bacterium]|nr:VWA domain-containing protein [Planctomycetota bacterium]